MCETPTEMFLTDIDPVLPAQIVLSTMSGELAQWMLKDAPAVEHDDQNFARQPGTDMTSSMLHISLTASQLAQYESF